MDFESCQEQLAKSGINVEGEFPQWTVYAHCRKPHWTEAIYSELAHITAHERKYDIVVINLPYVLGPKWRELSGGTPLSIECTDAKEIVELFQTLLAPRMEKGVLQIQ